MLNVLCGQKIAIVTDKPQTTRTRINGIFTDGDTQLVFTDTPGLHTPKTKLGEHMVKSVRESVTGGDVTVLVVESMNKNRSEPFRDDLVILDIIDQSRDVFLVINKIDITKDKTNIARTIDMFSKRFNFDAIIPLSAKTGDGVDILVRELKNCAEPGPFFFPEGTSTDQPHKAFTAELIREKIMRVMSQEIPHGIAVEIEKFTERASGLLDISALIYCEKDNHKGMIIGKGGENLKSIAAAARADIEIFFKSKVNLQCWIKVKEDWRNREGFIQNFGLK
ncbi:MAG: GTPase Era [Oscillospiraceae bacterium]|nr:GTPase Era [Oscillospiraceae bacterium]